MPGMRYTEREIEILIELDRRGLTDAEIGAYLGRTRGSIAEKLCLLRDEGRAYPSAIARRRDLTREQRETMALYRRKKLPAAEAWAAVGRMV